MLKIALQQHKRHPMHSDKILPWVSCAPFVENSRGVMEATQQYIHGARASAVKTR